MKFSSLLSIAKKYGMRAGFTMIELLIVVAILGILAATVLAAINPVEQINRARDTKTQSDAAQILTAVERYYTSQQTYPWMVQGTNTAYPWTKPGAAGIGGSQNLPFYAWTNGSAAADGIAPGTMNSGHGFNWAANMETVGEVKAGFAGQMIVQVPSIYFGKYADNGATPGSMFACFTPKSSTFKIQAAANCNSKQAPGVNGQAVQLIVPCPTTVTGPGGTVAATDTPLYFCIP